MHILSARPDRSCSQALFLLVILEQEKEDIEALGALRREALYDCEILREHGGAVGELGAAM